MMRITTRHTQGWYDRGWRRVVGVRPKQRRTHLVRIAVLSCGHEVYSSHLPEHWQGHFLRCPVCRRD